MRNAECKNSALRTGTRHSARSAFRTRPGFTLIELLVVIAVMAILAGFTLMVLSGVKRRQYINTASAELGQIAAALDSYKAKYGVYPPSNQNLNSVYTAKNQDRSEFSQLYYELSGTTNATIAGVNSFVTLDGNATITAADASTAYNVGGFINCSKGSGEDALVAKDFLSGVSRRAINNSVPNNSITTTMLVTSVGGPDQTYQPLNAPDLNPFRYVYPGSNNPTSYDLWIDLRISGKTNRISNWNHTPVIL